MLAGPLDYTPGGFDNVTRDEFNPRFQKPVVMYTRAHTLALYAIYESGLQMVSDYPEAYKNQKDFEFIKAAPATWDETRVLSGRPGDHVSIARRHGREWFVGSITGFRGADIDVPLSFLGPGQFVAEIYSDAPDANQNAKKTVISQERVTSQTVIKAKLANGGGQAIRIRPAQ
jgi:alpha-glucosidase